MSFAYYDFSGTKVLQWYYKSMLGVLHNIVRKKDVYNYDVKTDAHNFDNLTIHERNVNWSWIDIKDKFADYFMADVAVPFQYRML